MYPTSPMYSSQCCWIFLSDLYGSCLACGHGQRWQPIKACSPVWQALFWTSWYWLVVCLILDLQQHAFPLVSLDTLFMYMQPAQPLVCFDTLDECLHKVGLIGHWHMAHKGLLRNSIHLIFPEALEARLDSNGRWGCSRLNSSVVPLRQVIFADSSRWNSNKKSSVIDTMMHVSYNYNKNFHKLTGYLLVSTHNSLWLLTLLTLTYTPSYKPDDQ